jgi:hypothetical protein
MRLPGNRHADRIKLKPGNAMDERGLKADQIVAEVTNLYKAALAKNDVKFFDGVIAAVARLTNVPASDLLDPDNFKEALENFKQNVNVLNQNLKKPPRQENRTSADLSADAGDETPDVISPTSDGTQ